MQLPLQIKKLHTCTLLPGGLSLLTFHIFIDMLIFLDIDGVMVPMAGWKLPENGEDGFPVFSKKATEALNTLISIDTKIILTTSHRDRFSLDQWQTIFERRGLPIKNITRLESTTNFSKKRKDEILEWFENNQANNFIIIDDDKTLNSLPYHLKSKLILTSSMIGLTPEDLDQVLRTHH